MRKNYIILDKKNIDHSKLIIIRKIEVKKELKKKSLPKTKKKIKWKIRWKYILLQGNIWI